MNLKNEDKFRNAGWVTASTWAWSWGPRRSGTSPTPQNPSTWSPGSRPKAGSGVGPTAARIWPRGPPARSAGGGRRPLGPSRKRRKRKVEVRKKKMSWCWHCCWRRQREVKSRTMRRKWGRFRCRWSGRRPGCRGSASGGEVAVQVDAIYKFKK